jgi:hypothetical protein
MSIQTFGNLIQIMQHEKPLTPWQLAQKMGITTASVRALEDGSDQPNIQQIPLLTNDLVVVVGEWLIRWPILHNKQ